MLFSENQRRVLLTGIASLSLAGYGILTLAQDDLNAAAGPVFTQDSGTEKPSGKSKGRAVRLRGVESEDGTSMELGIVGDAASTLENLSTLDDVRALPVQATLDEGMSGEMGLGFGSGGEGMSGGGMPGAAGSMGMGMGMVSGSPPDARQIAMKKINNFRSKLASPDEDRTEVEKQLRSALSEYFIADLQHRVQELDAVKARVQQMEARLQKRLDLKQEAVDLQLKRMQHEADGLEFVVPNEAGASGEMGGMMGGGEMTGGYAGGSGGYPGMMSGGPAAFSEAGAGYGEGVSGPAPATSGAPGAARPRATGRK
jgi:hypothetical protein